MTFDVVQEAGSVPSCMKTVVPCRRHDQFSEQRFSDCLYQRRFPSPTTGVSTGSYEYRTVVLS